MLVGRVQRRLAAFAGEKINLAVNTVGPIERTAPQVIDALPSAHYVDVANDPIAVIAVLARGAAASAAGTTLVTCAGFGVIATRSAAVRAVEGRGPADSLRVDAPTVVASDSRALGEALAATIIDGIGSMARIPVRNRRDRPDFGARRELIVTPEGQRILSRRPARRSSRAAGFVQPRWNRPHPLRPLNPFIQEIKRHMG